MQNFKAVIFAFLATLSYTAETVIADQKLPKASPLVLTLFMGVGTTVVSLVLLLFSPDKISWPSKAEMSWVGVVVLLVFTADWMHFASLHYKAGAVVLCTSYALMPVLASIMKAEMPSARLALAWLCAGIALALAYKEVAGK